MTYQLILAGCEYREAIKNLLQFYIYDFSEWIDLDVESNGLFKPYSNFENYWDESPNRWPYIIKDEEKLIGFVFVRFIETGEAGYFSIAEFFILKKYRRKGIGKSISFDIFNLHKGRWEVFQKENNKPAQLFWNKIIDEYTKGKFREYIDNGRVVQNFETYPGDY